MKHTPGTKDNLSATGRGACECGSDRGREKGTLEKERARAYFIILYMGTHVIFYWIRQCLPSKMGPIFRRTPETLRRNQRGVKIDWFEWTEFFFLVLGLNEALIEYSWVKLNFNQCQNRTINQIVYVCMYQTHIKNKPTDSGVLGSNT